MINWGEEYFDHYEAFLRSPTSREIYRSTEHDHCIQVLSYENVFDGCMVYTTLGLTHYPSEVSNIAEVVLVADAGFEHCQSVLANLLFHMIDTRMAIVKGSIVKGIRNINKTFYEVCGKDGIYLAEPFGFPDEFSSVGSGTEKGHVLLACLISIDEAGYLKEFGAGRFESLLEEQSVDVFHVMRPSVV